VATRATEVAALIGTQLTDHAASAGGDKVSPGEGVVVLVLNTGASPITCTVVTPGTQEGLAIADQAVTCTNHATRRTAIPVPSRLYRNSADGLVDLQWSATTNVSFAIVRGQAD
jgi:hypothetical protein